MYGWFRSSLQAIRILKERQKYYIKPAFTLLELIIVLVIISILVSLAIPRYQRVAEKARASEGVRALGAIREAQIRYYEQFDTFATSLSNLDVDFTGNATKYFDLGTAPGIGSAGRKVNVDNPGNPPYQYQLSIEEDGTISCQDTNGECQWLGF